MSQKSLRTQFQEHPTRRQELQALMREAAFVDAIAIIKEESFQPMVLSKQIPAASIMEFYALNGAKKDGYLECMQNLLSLADFTVFRMPDRKAWDSPEKAEQIRKAEEAVAAPSPGIKLDESSSQPIT